MAAGAEFDFGAMMDVRGGGPLLPGAGPAAMSPCLGRAGEPDRDGCT